ncbi:hypothetical protein FQA39_LY06717 [Lamprigera yunnana]|nr:hypothetical protein FQA39_LY06717 [Lamprigera yunnana]
MLCRRMTKELQDIARKELNEDEGKDEHLMTLKNWLKKHHSNVIAEDLWLLNYLRGCKFDQNRVQEKLNSFYIMKSTVDLYENRDPLSSELQEVLTRGILLPLCGEDKEIILIRWANCHPNKSTLRNVLKVGLMLFETYINVSNTCMIMGHHVVIDCMGLPLSYVTQTTPTLIKNVMCVLIRNYPIRIKGVYLMNCFALTQLFYNITKQFLPKKIISRIHFYNSNNFSEIHKHIPLSVFPSEYGGDGGSVDTIKAETRGQGRRAGRSRGRGRGLGRSQGGVCSSNKANRRQNVDTSSSSSESDAIIETDSEYDEQVNSDTPESLDTSCIFCGMNYSSDTHGEEWIQCLSCSLWAHTACAGPEGENYICDFCR